MLPSLTNEGEFKHGKLAQRYSYSFARLGSHHRSFVTYPIHFFTCYYTNRLAEGQL